MFVQDRDSSRRYFTDVWRKHNEKKIILEPLEQQILNVILEHPEYHQFLNDEEKAMNFEVAQGQGESNPFLHMGMHIAIREQVQFDRPTGVRTIYGSILDEGKKAKHELEHLMMECFGKMLWQAQLANKVPDENEYLDCLKKLS